MSAITDALEARHTAALLAVLIMPASAYRLKLSANQGIGCKMLNKVMSDFMGDEDFLDCLSLHCRCLGQMSARGAGRLWRVRR